MTNKKKNNQRIKREKLVTEEQIEFTRFIKILLIIIIFVIGVYVFTRAFVTKDLFKKEENNTKTVEGSINYSTTLIGNMFNKPEKEYYVLMYDTEDLNAAYYSSFITNYSRNKEPLKVYFVNLNNTLNKKYITDNESQININTTNFEEFKVGKLALIKVSEGKIVATLTNEEEIAKELEYKETKES